MWHIDGLLSVILSDLRTVIFGLF